MARPVRRRARRHRGWRVKVIAYTYDADVHCPACTRKALARGTITAAPIWNIEPPATRRKNPNGMPDMSFDREGNEVGAMFSTDECPDAVMCADCGREV